ncbi:hypothetical protein K6119_02950 [Paracrocinitomix mangrovi]|uniref:nucleoside recognition domain-containing protein n=1 Tax=Paracrocinitomix mangrovi TaxID=2862509 RepID=UPI001C8EA1DF|nr:nucleoside recognition domain-containing protein [Paracrocinitomix mangrovi]UKN02478.1 hypothetical protein K6119_02950 [Paracrocinitomix mangrovi]
MVLNYIWIGFFLIALVVALVKTFGGDAAVFGDMVNSTFSMAETGFEISLYLTGVLCLWLGIMKIGENGGAVQALSKLVGPFFNKLFPDVPENHPARGSMLMNFSANMLGLDNAATPMGLKAMNELQELNKEKDRATNAMIMFLVLNTSGLTIIPITVMAYRSQFGAENPADVFIPILIATFCASLVGLIAVALYQKINLFDKVILAYLGGMSLIIFGLAYYFSSLPPEELNTQSSLASNIILYGVICLFIIMAIKKKVNVYESFIDGAKGGFDIAIKIIPYLIAILVSIGVFRASGAMDLMQEGFQLFFGLFFENTEFTNGIPTALMKPLSGSGARGMMIESFGPNGEYVDSYVGKLNSTLQGATDTTFYIIAVYFGAVGIKKTRYAVKVGLLADLAGVIAAMVVATLWFGGDKTVYQSPQEVVESFGNAWQSSNQESMKNLLSDNCVLYDQAYDTLYTNKSKVVDEYFSQNTFFRAVKTTKVMVNEVYLKINKGVDSSFVLETYAIGVKKGKIQYFRYLGNL